MPRKSKPETLSSQAQTRLRALAPKIWHFFEQMAVAEDHWLPPDNYRVQPGQAVAHRTSPTNIGYLLLATVAAFDFNLITWRELLTRLERVLTTLSEMQRYRGHWCNWYNTHTLEVLPPHYVSSVDSGNLAAALIVVKQTCIELGAADTEAAARWRALGSTTTALLDEMDFRFLYNSERDLFSIGYNLETNQRDQALYNLLGSEARLTSYITIALGQVPARHWLELGRPFGSVGGRPTLLCWGGSLFEYLMPTLFLPDYPFTLLNETYARVIACHIRYGQAHGVPWGNAEAGYYAFDNETNYQYKMFGVPELSIRRGILPEIVVAPYASFLALQYAPEQAFDNLQALEKLGGLTDYGFYESFDFAPERLAPGQSVAIVQEFMAHHQGISLAALDNVLNGGAIRRRFHGEPAMAAAEILLNEPPPQHRGSTDSA